MLEGISSTEFETLKSRDGASFQVCRAIIGIDILAAEMIEMPMATDQCATVR